jgi:hypothetical protein
MPLKKITISENSVIDLLKGIPEGMLVNIFMKLLIKYDSSPLKNDEKKALNLDRNEKKAQETINWQNIR